MKTIRAVHAGDQELLQGMLAADPRAIHQVYELALPSVIHWVKANQGTESDARDIFQDALMALYRRIEKGDFELTCSLKSYLRIVCRNLWLAKIRKARPVTQLEEEAEPIELDANIQQQMEQSERMRLYRKHFDQLEKGCQQILSLFFDRVPLAEIAQQLDTSTAYIKKRKFICKERLLENIQKDPEFESID